ncbi:ethylbenzene dehydrogenase-related protein [Persephonella sp.]
MKRTLLAGLLSLSLLSLSDDSIANEKNFFKYEVINGKYVKEEITGDPEDKVWKTARGKDVYLYPQISVRLNDKKANKLIPKKKRVTARVKVVYNDKDLAVYIRWKDSTPSVQSTFTTTGFGDGVSVQFPKKFGKGISLPYIGMGDEDHPVTVYLQKNVEGKDYEKVFISEGFGSLTEIELGDVEINMKYNEENKEWTAVIKRPLKTDIDNLKYGLVPIAFAIWDGEKYERDGNKVLSRWKFIKLNKFGVDEEYVKYVSWGVPYLDWYKKDRKETLGDPKRGKKLAIENGCNSCHRFDDQRMAPVGYAPDLSNIGVITNVIYLKESIINPNDVIVRNLNINRHYNKSAEPDKFKAYPNNDMFQWYITIDGKKQSKMPPFDYLSEEDLNDLIAYLKTLRSWKNNR